MKKRLLSGIKPTGQLHLGNYFGALRQFVDLQENYECFVMVANLHSLTTVKDPLYLRQLVTDTVLDYLAAGLDPKKTTIFSQADCPRHAELAWVFDCLATMPYLMRAHAFKDAEAKDKEINVGVFNYPMLMAADILLYDAEVVPVGKDQEQHIEISRDMARKFNDIYGETFIEPKALIMEEVAVVPGTDGRKMSKSYGNTIPLFASNDEWRQAVFSITTDSTPKGEPLDPEKDNIFALHKLISSPEDLSKLEKEYREGTMGYKESKELLLENIIRHFSEMRDKRNELAKKGPEYVKEVLNKGISISCPIATQKWIRVAEKTGLFL